MTPLPEYNRTGQDYSLRPFRYRGPIFDIHAHVTQTRPTDAKDGPTSSTGSNPSTDQAAVMLDEAAQFGIRHTVSMCPPEDIAPLRERLGDRILFNGMINKASPQEDDDVAFRSLDLFLAQGVVMLKFWSAPRGRERGLFVDAPWRIESVKRAIAAGVRVFMVHVGDPDAWFKGVYADAAKFGTKDEQYVPFRRMLEMFPQVSWIGAHLGGDSEHPDHLHALLEQYPHLYLDTSATKWVVREVSPRRDEFRKLMQTFPDRFLFGSDLVTRHHLVREHYTSRYWCQRMLWESDWEGPSPIADPDFPGPDQPTLRGLNLSDELLTKVYWENAQALLGRG